jgi:hypothetical protein
MMPVRVCVRQLFGRQELLRAPRAVRVSPFSIRCAGLRAVADAGKGKMRINRAYVEFQ